MPAGHLALVLHAHLPYVRHPEHEDFLEERWFYEAMTETYVPLLRTIDGWERDGVDYALLLSLSPPLVTMLEDELLQERYARHLRKLIALADRERERTARDPVFAPLARFYADFFRDILHWFEERCGRRLCAAFRRLAALGRLELMTCAGTHPFLPLLRDVPGALRAHLRAAVDLHGKVFGVAPEGMWLPECAWTPGLDAFLAEAGIRYFFVDTPAFDRAAERPVHGVYAPLYTPAGVAAFGRDKETSYQVWAAECGYPGHPDYREFYRDIGYDLPEEAVRELLVDGRIRTHTGIKYWRITHRGQEKKAPYDPAAARERAAEHAGNFLFNRQKQIEHLAARMDRPPLIVSPYDAELFGHWWFEGPRFLDCVIRKFCYDQDKIKLTTPRRYLAAFPENQTTVPASSSWGIGGTYEHWINPANDALLPDLQRAAERMSELAGRAGAEPGTERRLLAQMGRELMLAQASDWPFILKTGTSPEYARSRITSHLSRFRALEAMLGGAPDEERIAAIEAADRIFPDLRPEWFG